MGLTTLPCSVCRQNLPTSEFGRRRDRKRGFTSRCRSCSAAATKRSRAKRTPEQIEKAREVKRRFDLKTKFGISLEDYKALEQAQGNKCAICGSQEETLAVDHCHETGPIRGLLCGSCNLGLGKLGDTLEGLMQAVRYLEAHDRRVKLVAA